MADRHYRIAERRIGQTKAWRVFNLDERSFIIVDGSADIPDKERAEEVAAFWERHAEGEEFEPLMKYGHSFYLDRKEANAAERAFRAWHKEKYGRALHKSETAVEFLRHRGWVLQYRPEEGNRSEAVANDSLDRPAGC